jgi:hypothetical protein
MSDGADDNAPGWEAITAALEPLYQGEEPKHYGTIIKWSLGGPDPLEGILAGEAREGIGDGPAVAVVDPVPKEQAVADLEPRRNLREALPSFGENGVSIRGQPRRRRIPFFLCHR